MKSFIEMVFAGLCLILAACAFTREDAERFGDLVIFNGTILTMNDTRPAVEMVVSVGDRIVHAGSKQNIERWIGPHTRVIDLKGQTMTPGLIESHGHILYTGYAEMRLDLSGAKTYEQMISKVAAAVSEASPGEWILGSGWHQSKWDPTPDFTVKGFQTHDKLSRISPDNPVFLTHASGHAGFANSKAMEIAGISRETRFDAGGEIIKYEDGHPTGIFTESAQQLIRRYIPAPSRNKQREALKQSISHIISNGITSFHDASSDREAIDLYREFLKDEKLKIRLWVMINGRDKALLQEWYKRGPEIGLGNNHLTIRAIKLFSDGALGSRGAWLLTPYSDRPGHSGHAMISMDEVYQTASDALEKGFQLCVHAIGDRANREVLDQYEKAFYKFPAETSDHRFRIEHAQHLTTRDIPRFSQLGVIASMQGIHLSSDRPWAINRMGKKRIEEGAYVWQKLLETGARVINGTDTPVEPVNPIANFYASVTRKTLEGQPPGGYESIQKMTRQQALRSYTLDAAYAGFEENIKGSIENGKLADFTIFSQDIMTIPEDQILNTRVTATIIGGNVVYQEK